MALAVTLIACGDDTAAHHEPAASGAPSPPPTGAVIPATDTPAPSEPAAAVASAFATPAEVPSRGSGVVRAAWRLHGDALRDPSDEALIATDLDLRDQSLDLDDVDLRDTSTRRSFGQVYVQWLSPSGEPVGDADPAASRHERALMVFRAAADTQSIDLVYWDEPLNEGPVPVQSEGYEPRVAETDVTAWQHDDGDAHRLLVVTTDTPRADLPEVRLLCGGNYRGLAPEGIAEIDDADAVLSPDRTLPAIVARRRFVLAYRCEPGHVPTGLHVGVIDRPMPPAGPVPSGDEITHALAHEDAHQIAEIDLESPSTAPAISRDGRLALVADADAVLVLDATSGARLGAIPRGTAHAHGTPMLALSDDASRAFVVWDGTGVEAYSLRDPRAPASVGSARLDHPASSLYGVLALSPDGAWAAVGHQTHAMVGWSDTLAMLQLPAATPRASLAALRDGTEERVLFAGFADAHTVVSCATDGAVRAWSAPAFQPSELVREADVHVSECALAGRTLAIGTREGRVILGALHGAMRGENLHEGEVRALALVDAGVVSAGADGRVVLLPRTGESRVLLEGEGVSDLVATGPSTVLVASEHLSILDVASGERIDLPWRSEFGFDLSAASSDGRVLVASDGAAARQSIVRLLRTR